MAIEPPDIREKGRNQDGQVVAVDARIFMQFHAFGDCTDVDAVVAAATAADICGAVYIDANDSRGIGIVAVHEDAEYFVTAFRDLLNSEPFAMLSQKPEFTMFGRTYSIGYEQDLSETLLHRPTRNILNPEAPWAVWYPLRRKGAFEQLEWSEQRGILGEHGTIGRSWGMGGLASDVRLACHGIDANDNDFVIGLIGSQLHPLSALVQRMRKTQQTSSWLERLGPFFVGHAVWQSARPAPCESRQVEPQIVEE
jgi:chlorite dismutase